MANAWKITRPQIAFLLALAAAGIGVISKFALTSGELLPGIDGAYYWVQVRSILHDFTLAFDDLPLVLWAQSLIGLIVGDIPLGVRISDALLPALSAIPIFLILRKSKSVIVPAVAILVVLLHPIQLYFFTGDFLKNSAAIPLVFFIGWILYNWENVSWKRSTIYLLVCLGLLAISHFGTLLMGILIVAVWLIVHLRNKSRRFWITSIGISFVSISAVLAGLAILVPSRFDRLLEFLSQPANAFANPAWQMLFGGRNDYPITFGIITGQIGAVLLGYWGWKVRKNLSDSQLSLVIASLVSTFILSSPFIAMEWANRLVAMSFVPLLLSAMIIWMASEKLATRFSIGALTSLTLIASLVFSFVGVKQPMISDSQYKDLVKLSKNFEFPENSIVVARHGVEFLVAWLMKTNVLQESSYADEDLSSYGSVYYLESTGGFGGFGGMKDRQGNLQLPFFGQKPPAGLKFDGKNPPPGFKPGSGFPSMPNGFSGAGAMNAPVKIEGTEVSKTDSFTLKKVR